MELKSIKQEFVSLERQENERDDEIDLLQLVLPIWHRKWSILSLVVVVMMLAALIAMNMTPIYRATSTLMIESANRTTDLEMLSGLSGAGNEYLLTQFELLKERELAERVVKKLNLTEHPAFDPRQQEPAKFNPRQWLAMVLPADIDPPEEEVERAIFDRVVDALMARTQIMPVRNTALVKINMDMADPALAAEAANELANAYITSQLESRLATSMTVTNWMNSQLTEQREKLQIAERNLQAFREQENLVDIQGIVTISADELSEMGTRLVDARRARAEAESLYRQVAALKNSGWQRQAEVPAVLSNPMVQQFRTKQAQAQAKVDELAGIYGPLHPDMMAAQTELRSAEVDLQAQVEQVVASIEQQYLLSVANERSLQNSFDENRGAIQQITSKEFELRKLEREVESNQQLYDTFMTRLNEISSTQDFEAINARVVGSAVVPKRPVKPRKALIVVIAGLMAFIAAAGLTLLLNRLSNSFRSVRDVEAALNQPMLGMVPLVKKHTSNVARLYDGEDKSFSETIRTLRTSIVLSALEHPRKVLLMTSSVPGEGKSTVGSNLAASLVQFGKVLVIDADLRRPTLHKNYALPVGTAGLANYLADTATLDECIRSTDTIDLLPAGAVPPNPQELLMSPRLEQLLSELRERYDYIIVDSPPCMAVSDAVILSALVDSVIYVVKANATPIPVAQRGVGQLLQKNAAILGVVLNQVDVKKAQRYGESYEGYYDYYGYSSGSAS
ncbi:MAG: polysaccharide biosynthesis tyrosine autokinase [Porticoccaceae bacterium]|nr:polysaccharide biosynthesis tyrosine autokinase [Porticoccaceae bacterium]